MWREFLELEPQLDALLGERERGGAAFKVRRSLFSCVLYVSAHPPPPILFALNLKRTFVGLVTHPPAQFSASPLP